jgi:hypothetical protein
MLAGMKLPVIILVLAGLLTLARADHSVRQCFVFLHSDLLLIKAKQKNS